MASNNTKKKPLPFPVLMGIFFGGFILVMIITYFAVAGGSSAQEEVVQSRTVTTQTTTQATAGQAFNTQGQPIALDANGQPFNPNNDVNSYLAESNIANQTNQAAKDVQLMNSQMQAIVSEVNQGNNNVLQQLQKVQTDMILLDQRLTNIENALNSGWKKQ